MGIVGFGFTSMSAKFDEKKLISTNLDIGSSPQINNVERREMRAGGLKEAVVITFTFTTKYDPDVAHISFTGEVICQTPNIAKVVKTWKDTEKLDDDIAIEVLNVIFRRCLAKAVGIADDLRLPPPLTFPIVAPRPSADGKEGKEKETREKKR